MRCILSGLLWLFTNRLGLFCELPCKILYLYFFVPRCVQCDTLFPDREGLDTHREQMCHYEFAIDMAGYRDYGDDGDDTDSFITDDDENGFGYSDEGDDEEMERLL